MERMPAERIRADPRGSAPSAFLRGPYEPFIPLTVGENVEIRVGGILRPDA
jgi:hypothetical protein